MTTTTTNKIAAYRIIFKDKKIFELIKKTATKNHISIRQFIEEACKDKLKASE